MIILRLEKENGYFECQDNALQCFVSRSVATFAFVCVVPQPQFSHSHWFEVSVVLAGHFTDHVQNYHFICAGSITNKRPRHRANCDGPELVVPQHLVEPRLVVYASVHNQSIHHGAGKYPSSEVASQVYESCV